MAKTTGRRTGRTGSGILAAIVLAMCGGAVPAATIPVADATDQVQVDGLCSLREAIDNANLAAGGDASGGDCVAGDAGQDTIELPSGTFTLGLAPAAEDANAGGDLDLLDDVRLVGAGIDLTLIESDGADRVLDAGPGTPGIVIEIEALTLAFGIAPAGGDGGGLRVGSAVEVTAIDVAIAGNAAGRGGGVFNEGTLEMTGGRFQQNRAEGVGDGGGIYNAGTATFTSTPFIADSAENRGGGIYNAAALTTTDASFSFETAVDGGALYNAGTGLIQDTSFGVCHVTGNGGAVYHDGLSFALIRAQFLNNSAEMNGASIYTRRTAIIQHSWVAGGVAYQDGGGIYHELGNLLISDTRVEQNQAGERGAGISNHSNLQGQRLTLQTNYGNLAGGGLYNTGVAICVGCEVRWNYTVEDGGGIHNQNFLSFIASSFSGNGAQRGGGLFAPAGTISNLLNTTVSGNTAWVDAGGLHIEGDSAIGFGTITENTTNGGTAGGLLSLGNVTLKNTVIAGNDVDCVQAGTVVSEGYNLDGDGSCGLGAIGDLIGVAPMLLPLGDFGGPTLSHAPLVGSPLIDSAAPDCRDQLGQVATTDQRQMARPMDGDGDAIAICDRGSFEAALPQGPVPEVSPTLTVGKPLPYGNQLELSWDTSGCPGLGYHAIWGFLDDVADLTITGDLCELDPSGSDVWNNSPNSNLWFLLIADDGDYTEGGWGSATSGPRKPGVPSGRCEMYARDDSGVCP